MSRLYVFSGPCGCGKSMLADAWARHLVDGGEHNQVYVIHGDSFHAGFQYWPDILRFNWECILSVAGKALEREDWM